MTPLPRPTRLVSSFEEAKFKKAPTDRFAVFVQGPYLVRSASFNETGRSLALTGDADKETEITVFASASLCSITWNGKKLELVSRDGNTFTAKIEGPATFDLPGLGPWKVHDSLPEIAKDYEATSESWVGKLYPESIRSILLCHGI